MSKPLKIRAMKKRTAKGFIKAARLNEIDGKPDRKMVYKKLKKERKKKEEEKRKMAFV